MVQHQRLPLHKKDSLWGTCAAVTAKAVKGGKVEALALKSAVTLVETCSGGICALVIDKAARHRHTRLVWGTGTDTEGSYLD